MAPKRLSSSSSTPSPKKARLSAGQQTLHSFFRSPSKNGEAFNEIACGVDIGDRELAEKLAEQEGFDIETAKRSEDSWAKVRAETDKNASDAIADAHETPTNLAAESSLAS